MSAFDPPLPPPDAALPTPSSGDGAISADSLLSGSFGLATATAPVWLPPLLRSLKQRYRKRKGKSFCPVQLRHHRPPPLRWNPRFLQPPNLPSSQPSKIPPAYLVKHWQVIRRYNYPSLRRLVASSQSNKPGNNCGPANITMALSFFGWSSGQEVAQAYVRPSTEDKNVNPWELVAFVREQTGFQALTRIGGPGADSHRREHDRAQAIHR